jgi:hypothetical protein
LSQQVTGPENENVDPAKKTKDFAEANGAIPRSVNRDRPFSQEDLNLALKRTHLEVPSAA